MRPDCGGERRASESGTTEPDSTAFSHSGGRFVSHQQCTVHCTAPSPGRSHAHHVPPRQSDAQHDPQGGPLRTGCFFIFFVKDRPKGPPQGTTNRQPPTATNRQPPPTANHQPPPTASGDQPPTATHHQPPPTASCQLPTANRHQLPTANRHQPWLNELHAVF